MLKLLSPQIVVLAGFAFLLREVLTVPTLIFTAAGFLLVLMDVKPKKFIRNALAIAVFGSYWIKYGKLIDPEVGLNFLTSIIVLKLLEKESLRDSYMIFFGLILLISAGSLFERTLTYVFFFGLSFLFLIRDFYAFLGSRWRMKDLLVAIAWVMPLTFLLFFFIPRLLNPIPFQQSTTAPGEIGYTPDVNISDLEKLEGNTSPAFQVIVSRKLGQKELYWRANSLSYNDGWNWKDMPQDRESPSVLLGYKDDTDDIRQSYRLFLRPEYFISLDYPRALSYGREYFSPGDMTLSIPQNRWDWVGRYDVYSSPVVPKMDPKFLRPYLNVPLPKIKKQQLMRLFPGTTVPEISASVQRYFRDEKFVYSLAPGRSESLEEFFTRKIGLCSHYASATALILRIKGIPARLVSGFMGGSFNEFAGFYALSQNDAHVWVEAWSEGSWVRLDPTEWIAPERVQLGGEAFMQNVREGQFQRTGVFRMPKAFRDLKMWFEQWDFRFYQWLEQMDYHTQDAFLTKMKLKREWLFSLIPLIMLAFMLFYMWYLATRKNTETLGKEQELLREFFLRMHKKGISLSRVSVEAVRGELTQLEDQSFLLVWDELVSSCFGGKVSSYEELRKKIRSL